MRGDLMLPSAAWLAMVAGTVVLYVLATAGFFAHLMRVAPCSARPTWARSLLIVGVTLHAATVVGQSLEDSMYPVASMRAVLSLAAIVMVLGFLFGLGRGRREALGVLVAPLALTMLLASEVMASQRSFGPMPRALLLLHVSANLVGSGVLMLACLVGVTYLIQSVGLKRRPTLPLWLRLPGLSALEAWTSRLHLTAFVALTIGVVTGGWFAERAPQDPVRAMRLLAACLAWLLVGSTSVLGRVLPWRGRRIAWGAVASGVLIGLVLVLYTWPEPRSLAP